MDETLINVNLDESTTRYDAAFLNVVPEIKPTWLPWVGQRFSARPQHQRLLVVGESHYYKGDTPEKREADRVSYLTGSHWTREQVSDSHIYGRWKPEPKTLTNIPKFLFRTTKIDRLRLWSDSAYYNFIQRPMDYNREGGRERPTGDDYMTGWRVFAEVVRIIRPSHCLFIGVTAANFFNPWIASQNLLSGNVSKTQTISRTSARAGKLEVTGTTTELIFVKHLGMPINCSKWNDYVQAQHADFMSWLGAESYAKDNMAC